jgi:hypothetical protein
MMLLLVTSFLFLFAIIFDTLTSDSPNI